MDVVFRTANSSDVNSLLSLMRSLYEHDHLVFNEEAASDALNEILSDSSLGRIWLIQSGEEAIGYVVLTYDFSLEFHGKVAFVDEIFIRKEYRGSGVGQQTFQFVEEYCRTSGIKTLHLMVEKNNKKAQIFYQKAGFKTLDRFVLMKWLDKKS
ncbi:GNAT family N-acetyltransferase [Candidatus Acetothermia bacterium]|nr:GNAT family N-acetyltransferase [Candidatus Acetothermia bacterium]MBI3643093.1 GNAT family N-acetyltransferase [Candidatus Acetothermia bacterium]